MEEKHWQVLVLILRNIAKEKGITYEDIAEKTGLKTSNISRVFSMQYSPTLRNFITIARAIEVHFFFEDKEGLTDLSIIFEKAMTELGRRTESLPKN